MKHLLNFYRTLSIFRGFAHVDEKFIHGSIDKHLRFLLALPSNKRSRALNATILSMILGNKSNITNRVLLQRLEQIYSHSLIVRVLKNNQITSDLQMTIQESDSKLWQYQQWYFLLQKCYPEFTQFAEWFRLQLNFDANNNDISVNYWQDLPLEQVKNGLESAMMQTIPMSYKLIGEK